MRLNPYRPYEESYFSPYDEEQQLNAKDYGYDLAYARYRPHITLARYKEGMVPETILHLPPAGKLSFPLTKIWVCKADENGAVYEKLAEFTLA